MNSKDEQETSSIPGTPFIIEHMAPLPGGDDPASEDYDWFHTYTVINKDVYVFDFGREDNTEYIIVAHRPSGSRFKIRFTSNVFQFEGMAHIPRSILDSNLTQAKSNRLTKIVDRKVDEAKEEVKVTPELEKSETQEVTEEVEVSLGEAVETKQDDGVEEVKMPFPQDDIIPEAVIDDISPDSVVTDDVMYGDSDSKPIII